MNLKTRIFSLITGLIAIIIGWYNMDYFGGVIIQIRYDLGVILINGTVGHPILLGCLIAGGIATGVNIIIGGWLIIKAFD